MWPVNWPGENQKGKSGGSLSWNSAWILGKEPSWQQPPSWSPPSYFGPNGWEPLARLCVEERARQAGRTVCGAERRPEALQGLPIHRSPARLLSSHSLSRACASWCHSSTHPSSCG